MRVNSFFGGSRNYGWFVDPDLQFFENESTFCVILGLTIIVNSAAGGAGQGGPNIRHRGLFLA